MSCPSVLCTPILHWFVLLDKPRPTSHVKPYQGGLALPQIGPIHFHEFQTALRSIHVVHSTSSKTSFSRHLVFLSMPSSALPFPHQPSFLFPPPSVLSFSCHPHPSLPITVSTSSILWHLMFHPTLSMPITVSTSSILWHGWWHLHLSSHVVWFFYFHCGTWVWLVHLLLWWHNLHVCICGPSHPSSTKRHAHRSTSERQERIHETTCGSCWPATRASKCWHAACSTPEPPGATDGREDGMGWRPLGGDGSRLGARTMAIGTSEDEWLTMDADENGSDTRNARHATPATLPRTWPPAWTCDDGMDSWMEVRTWCSEKRGRTRGSDGPLQPRQKPGPNHT